MTVRCALSTLTLNHCSLNMISMSYVTFNIKRDEQYVMFGVKHLRFQMSGAHPPKKLRHTSQLPTEACID